MGPVVGDADLHVLILHAVFFFQAEDGIRDYKVTGVQTCALPILWCRRCRGFWHRGWHWLHLGCFLLVDLCFTSPQEKSGDNSDETEYHRCEEHCTKIGRASCRERV